MGGGKRNEKKKGNSRSRKRGGGRSRSRTSSSSRSSRSRSRSRRRTSRHRKGRFVSASERDEFEKLKKKDQKATKKKDEARLEAKITKRLLSKGTGSDPAKAGATSSDSDSDSSRDSRSARRRAKAKKKKEEQILLAKRNSTKLKEIERLLAERLPPETASTPVEGNPPEAEKKSFTLEEWKAIAEQATAIAERSHPSSPAPARMSGNVSASRKGKGKTKPGAKKNLDYAEDDDVFASFSSNGSEPLDKASQVLDNLRQKLTKDDSKANPVKSTKIGKMLVDDEERLIRSVVKELCDNIFLDDTCKVGLEALCDTFGISTEASTVSGVLQVIVRVCARRKISLSRSTDLLLPTK